MKLISKILIAGALAAGIAFPAFAQGGSGIKLTLSPTTGTIPVNGSETFNVNVSGLNGSVDYAGPGLGAFDFALDYNPAIATVTAVSYGSAAGVDQLNLDGNAIQFTTLTAGQAQLLESSDYSVSQPSSFTLATVTLQGVSAGTTSLTFDASSGGPSLSDENGNSLDVISATGASLTVTAIPEPSVTAGVLGVLALGAMMLRRRLLPA
jgi:hypothetical protein